MTFRQALSAIWQRRILIITVIVLAVAVAAVFLARQTPIYTSSITVRMSSLAASASASGQIGTATVDFDPESITSPEVLDAAAKAAGEPAGSAESWAVGYTLNQGSNLGQAKTVTITANGSTSEEARKHSAAVATAYNSYLQEQTAKAKTAAEAQVAKWTTAAELYQTQVNASPGNSIAQANLSNAIDSLSSANNTLDKINNAAPPLTVTSAASAGQFKGTSPLVAFGTALAAGLVAGIGIALIWDAFDDRLRGEEELEDLIDVPPLGELSLDRRMQRKGDWLPAAGRKRTALNEGLRALRTTLQVLLPPGNNVIVFTSVEPGDGKTFISSNLALAWSRTGKQVVLVGGDLRKPSLDLYFGDVATGPGLTELLQSAATQGSSPTTDAIARSLRPTKFRGLSVLPAGSEPWDPADLLAVQALGDIIASLRQLCDIVVIDSPPSFALVDASLLAAHTDGAVLVASIRRTRRKRLVETVHALAGNGITVLGVVANRSRRRIPKSYSAYYGTNSSARRRSAQLRRREDARPAADSDANGFDDHASREPGTTPSDDARSTRDDGQGREMSARPAKTVPLSDSAEDEKV
ncbi:polysaccharide biosynthesis tyrosine autokinase [Rathayibacter sp. CAU 1779]